MKKLQPTDIVKTPSGVKQAVRILAENGVRVPELLVDTLMDLTKRRLVTVEPWCLGQALWDSVRIHVPFDNIRSVSKNDGRIIIHSKPSAESFGRLSDLGLRLEVNNSTWVWYYGAEVVQSHYSVYGHDALVRFAELCEIPLIDFMALSGVLDLGTKAVLALVRSAMPGYRSRAWYGWRLHVFPVSRRAESMLQSVDTWKWNFDSKTDGWSGPRGRIGLRVLVAYTTLGDGRMSNEYPYNPEVLKLGLPEYTA